MKKNKSIKACIKEMEKLLKEDKAAFKEKIKDKSNMGKTFYDVLWGEILGITECLNILNNQ